jgi:hypothetical protein
LSPAVALLNSLSDHKIALTVLAGELRVSAPRAILTAHDRSQLVALAPELCALIQSTPEPSRAKSEGPGAGINPPSGAQAKDQAPQHPAAGFPMPELWVIPRPAAGSGSAKPPSPHRWIETLRVHRGINLSLLPDGAICVQTTLGPLPEPVREQLKASFEWFTTALQERRKEAA